MKQSEHIVKELVPMTENPGSEHEPDHDPQISLADGTDSPEGDEALLQDPGEPRCIECGGLISQSDVVCPHCGVSLVAG